VVAAEGIDRQVAAKVAERLLAAVERPIEVAGVPPVQLSASIGVVWGQAQGCAAADLLARADTGEDGADAPS
jgi:GGDEF domain-containing protein